jgi:hypothetical protein
MAIQSKDVWDIAVAVRLYGGPLDGQCYLSTVYVPFEKPCIGSVVKWRCGSGLYTSLLPYDGTDDLILQHVYDHHGLWNKKT